MLMLFFSALGHRSCIMGQAVIPINCFLRTIKTANICRRKLGFLQDFHQRRKSAWKDLPSDRMMEERAGVTQAGIGNRHGLYGIGWENISNYPSILTYAVPPNWFACYHDFGYKNWFYSKSAHDLLTFLA